MGWGLVLAGAAMFIAWRRPRVDRAAVVWLLAATVGVVLLTYRTLGG